MKPEFKPEFKLDPPSPKKKSPKEETLPVIYSVRMVGFPHIFDEVVPLDERKRSVELSDDEFIFQVGYAVDWVGL